MVKRKRLTGHEKAHQLLKLSEFGDYLFDLREERGKTLAEVANVVGVSSNYLSDLERGLKSPSDELIRELAKFYNLDEEELFDRLEKVPLSLIEEVKEFPSLKTTLMKIQKDKRLNEAKKKKFYDAIFELYENFMDDDNGDDDGDDEE